VIIFEHDETEIICSTGGITQDGKVVMLLSSDMHWLTPSVVCLFKTNERA
jgi:hypothetical protein